MKKIFLTGMILMGCLLPHELRAISRDIQDDQKNSSSLRRATAVVRQGAANLRHNLETFWPYFLVAGVAVAVPTATGAFLDDCRDHMAEEELPSYGGARKEHLCQFFASWLRVEPRGEEFIWTQLEAVIARLRQP